MKYFYESTCIFVCVCVYRLNNFTGVEISKTAVTSI